MYSDGKYTISWGEIGAGMPRLIIAVFIGIIISTPLELKIFDVEIEEQIIIIQQEKEGIAMKKADEKIENDIKRREQLENEIKDINKRLNDVKSDLASEKLGTRSGKAGIGPIYYQLKNQEAAIESEKKTWENLHLKELAGLNKKITESQKKTKSDIDNTKKDGFSIRYEAYNDVKKENKGMATASFFITLLFIIIEICPTLFKMMIASGPYDCLLDAERHSKKVASMKIISDVNDKINTEIQISTKKNLAYAEQKLKNNKELMDQLSAVQAEILSKAIAAWREEEMKKVLDNPSAYIKSNKPS